MFWKWKLKIKYAILGVAVLLPLLSLFLFIKTRPQFFGGVAPQVVNTADLRGNWDKPTTDKAWADVSKSHAFDFRSNEVLHQMIDSHTAKVAREEKDFKEYQDCPQCIFYKYKQQFIDSGMSDQDATLEAQRQADTETKQRLTEIQNIHQYLNEMQKELDLRKSGYLVTDDTAQPASLGAVTDPNRIRHIHN